MLYRRSTVGEGLSKGCPCKKAVELLASLGAEHACKMHELMAKGKTPGDFTPLDWHLHMAEEEALLMPILDRHGMSTQATKIMQDHERFRAELRAHGKIVSTVLLDAHSHLENEICARLLPD